MHHSVEPSSKRMQHSVGQNWDIFEEEQPLSHVSSQTEQTTLSVALETSISIPSSSSDNVKVNDASFWKKAFESLSQQVSEAQDVNYKLQQDLEWKAIEISTTQEKIDTIVQALQGKI
ncbi:unnamed protein product, partial [Mesorhabditis belari]|uniref:Uncharacterized protein n=1 Tax=Mesorhabditis belari TaxID=2138241 RepID=A0AAF3EJ56_9BILA